ncbi:hypothetical protein J0895_16765 [Phormidium pseudopriestleyi FRX01]|uniref:Uncharacterized protein n=1 Tax=Phormidium pseudopriestleyi FRX01 TaxID=1759528 RepID=A0ABS3FUI2_9CYAN|nr:hypothetical protein [Phormidium pseudopriestleyi]MBO0350713.1 hypothetical protein [Phormidium pseudopriestleyi FRX01]
MKFLRYSYEEKEGGAEKGYLVMEFHWNFNSVPMTRVRLTNGPREAH